MFGRRLLVHTVFLFLLPLVVAGFGLSLASASLLVLLMLLWRWAISLSVWVAPARQPGLELETISASHFVEKVRWCMDRLGVEYSERPVAGTLGAFFLGRTVPRLFFRSGAVRSSIGNSSEILRYLWGRYASELGEQSEFLEPTAERLELEQRIDRCGVDLQVWIYYHILDDRDLSLHAWGVHNPAIPAWQRLMLRLLFPMLRWLIRRSFRITPERYTRAVAHIDALLASTEELLGDGRASILGGNHINYTDIAFAAIMGLWLQPSRYGGVKADTVRVERSRYPEGMATDVDRWQSRYPLATAFIESLYETRS
jgi:glutathione S-transferase